MMLGVKVNWQFRMIAKDGVAFYKENGNYMDNINIQIVYYYIIAPKLNFLVTDTKRK